MVKTEDNILLDLLFVPLLATSEFKVIFQTLPGCLDLLLGIVQYWQVQTALGRVTPSSPVWPHPPHPPPALIKLLVTTRQTKQRHHLLFTSQDLSTLSNTLTNIALNPSSEDFSQLLYRFIYTGVNDY